MYSEPDRNGFTPLTTAYEKLEKEEKDTTEVIYEILSALSREKCINAITHPYCGLPAIEYDIKSGRGAIVKVSSKVIT